MPNSPSQATTNTKENSEKRDPKNVLTFAELKANYPSSYPCDKEKYSDQCAIKVAVSLKKSGVSFKTFKGVTCGNLWQFAPW